MSVDSDVDRRLALRATGALAAFNRADVLEAADVHVAVRTADLAGDTDELAVLAVAFAVRALRAGSVCVDLTRVEGSVDGDAGDLPWPDTAAWLAAVRDSALVGAGVLRVEGSLVYLDRYHRLEAQVADDLLARRDTAAPAVDDARLARALADVRGEHFSAEQEEAAVQAVRQHLTVLTGGPGTGKTTSVARMLVLLAVQADAPLSIALAAPTGKAATRLQEAVRAEFAGLGAAGERVGAPEAMTLHRLLGWRPDNATRFRHHRGNRLKYDVVVVDECSMVDLTMMGRLLEAVRPESRLVLVGDPDQLTSVGAGAVLADVVSGFGDSGPVAPLHRNHRFRGDIKALAEALDGGDADQVVAVLRGASSEVEYVEHDPETVLRPRLLDTARRLRDLALAGDAGAALAVLDEHRLLCAHREGAYGVRHWNRQVERWLAEESGQPVPGEWYVGRPLLVTSNDYALDVYNGETGVAVRAPDGRLRAWVDGSGHRRDLAPGRLDAVETMHAMTIHKSQGSQAAEVTVLLPEPGSRLLTRELLYTAITRAQRQVRVVGSEAAVREAVERRADRASGLGPRLKQP